MGLRRRGKSICSVLFFSKHNVAVHVLSVVLVFVEVVDVVVVVAAVVILTLRASGTETRKCGWCSCGAEI